MIAQLKAHLVNVTPVPTFPRFVGTDDRMTGGVEMGRGVSRRGLVATADVATGLAGAKMNPVVLAGGQTVFTSLGLGDGIGYRVEVIADFQMPGSFSWLVGRLNPRAGIHLSYELALRSPPTTISGIIAGVIPGREKNLGFLVCSALGGGIKQPSVPGVGASASTPGTVFCRRPSGEGLGSGCTRSRKQTSVFAFQILRTSL